MSSPPLSPTLQVRLLLLPPSSQAHKATSRYILDWWCLGFGFFVWCLSTVCGYYKPVHSLPRFSQASCQFLSGLWVLYFSDGFSFFFPWFCWTEEWIFVVLDFGVLWFRWIEERQEWHAGRRISIPSFSVMRKCIAMGSLWWQQEVHKESMWLTCGQGIIPSTRATRLHLCWMQTGWISSSNAMQV